MKWKNFTNAHAYTHAHAHTKACAKLFNEGFAGGGGSSWECFNIVKHFIKVNK